MLRDGVDDDEAAAITISLASSFDGRDDRGAREKIKSVNEMAIENRKHYKWWQKNLYFLVEQLFLTRVLCISKTWSVCRVTEKEDILHCCCRCRRYKCC